MSKIPVGNIRGQKGDTGDVTPAAQQILTDTQAAAGSATTARNEAVQARDDARDAADNVLAVVATNDGIMSAVLDTPGTSFGQKVDARVESGMSEIAPDVLASDPTIRAAAVTATNAAVDAKVVGMDLLLASSPRVRAAVPAQVLLPDADSKGRVMGGYDPATGARVNYGGTLTPWAGQIRTDIPGHSFAIVDPVTNRVTELALDESGHLPAWVVANLRARMAQQSVRRVPLVLTGAGGGLTENVDTGYMRIPLMVAATAHRWRLHLRNYDDNNQTARTGAVTIRGVWLGEGGRDAFGELSGELTAAPTQVLGGFVTSETGAEYVSDWVSTPLLPRRDLLLSIAFSNTPGQTNYRARGGCFRGTVNADAELVTPSVAPSRSEYCPFDIWLECEIDDTVSVLVGQGDSLSLGTGTRLPVFDAWLYKLAIAQGVWPWLLAIHGSNQTQWVAPSNTRYAKFAGLTRPDAIIEALGSNDMMGGMAATAAQTQTNHLAVLATLRTVFGQGIPTYATTILPRVGTDPTIEGNRVAYNEWLLGLPAGHRNVFDVAAAIADPANPAQMLARYNSGDNVHLRSSGQAAIARTIPAPLATR